MGTTLTGTTPQDTYDSLIKVTDNGPLSGTAKYLSDGLGNDSVLALSTSRVGIGTADPAHKFAISSTTDADLMSIVSSASANATILRFGIDGNDANITASGGSVGNLVFKTYGSERMRITSAGNVGIGTSTPAALLSLYRAADASININTAATGTFPIKSGISFGAATTSLGGDNKYLGGAGIQGVNITQSDNVTDLLFWTTAGGSPSEKVRVLSSGGITFNGDTAAANALDDYEEGTWTPVFAGTTTAGTYTYSFNSGGYRKIGSQVTVWGSLVDITESSAGTGDWKITSLPFTTSSDFVFARGVGSLYVRQAAATRTGLALLFSNGSTTLSPAYNNGSSDASSFTIAADYAAGMDIGFTLTYYV
jgi:hypothetical protein